MLKRGSLFVTDRLNFACHLLFPHEKYWCPPRTSTVPSVPLDSSVIDANVCAAVCSCYVLGNREITIGVGRTEVRHGLAGMIPRF